MVLVFYVSAIKIDADGLGASQAQCVLRHHVKCKLIKIPQLAMRRNVKEMGHDFIRNREWEISKPLANWGKAKCPRENPSA